jgi:hypothetical protein
MQKSRFQQILVSKTWSLYMLALCKAIGEDLAVTVNNIPGDDNAELYPTQFRGQHTI